MIQLVGFSSAGARGHVDKVFQTDSLLVVKQIRNCKSARYAPASTCRTLAIPTPPPQQDATRCHPGMDSKLNFP